MFEVVGTEIHCTRGDCGSFLVRCSFADGLYTFRAGDAIRFRVCRKKDYGTVVLTKEVKLTEATQEVEIYLDSEDTRIGEIINKPVDYWYEVELVADGKTQTIFGHTVDGARVFKLLPEGKEE